MQWLVGIIMGLVSLLIYKSNKLSDAQGLAKNQKVKQKLLDKDKEQLKNDAKIDELNKQLEDLEK